MGATAIETAFNAIKEGANKVTMVVRKYKPVWGKDTVHEMTKQILNPLNFISNINRKRGWKKIGKYYIDIINKMNHPVINEIHNETTMIDGENINLYN